MAATKTAVSLPQELFERIDQRALKMKLSRSRLITLAAEDYLRRLEDDEFTAKLNAVYDEEPLTDEERQFMEAASAALADHLEAIGDKW
jgi:metal-responsive CopG/Arc/MetJ family transcriptional regulator